MHGCGAIPRIVGNHLAATFSRKKDSPFPSSYLLPIATQCVVRPGEHLPVWSCTETLASVSSGVWQPCSTGSTFPILKPSEDTQKPLHTMPTSRRGRRPREMHWVENWFCTFSRPRILSDLKLQLQKSWQSSRLLWQGLRELTCYCDSCWVGHDILIPDRMTYLSWTLFAWR